MATTARYKSAFIFQQEELHTLLLLQCGGAIERASSTVIADTLYYGKVRRALEPLLCPKLAKSPKGPEAQRCITEAIKEFLRWQVAEFNKSVVV